MKSLKIVFFALPLIAFSCEKDFIDDIECQKQYGGGNIIDDWQQGDSTDIHQHKDTVNSFEVELKDWEESITIETKLK